MWTLLTMSLLPPYGSWWHTIIIMTLKWYPLQNCWLSDKVTVILNVESKFLRKKLIFVKPFTCASPNMMKGTSSFFSTCWKNLHVRHRTLPSWGSQDRDSSKISTLPFSIKSMLENRESLFFTESRQYIRPAPWNRVFAQNGFEIYSDV